MTALPLKCPNCLTDSTEPLNLLDGRLAGPITTLRVRSTGGEHNLRVVVLTCSECGLVSTYDADSVQAQLESTS